MTWKGLAIAALLVLPASVCEAQKAKVPVYVEASGQDLVGQQLVYFFKEALRGSSTFTVALEEGAGFQVSIVHLDPDPYEAEATRGLWTVYSATWLLRIPKLGLSYHLNQVVGTCGVNRIRSCADSLMVITNDQAERVARLLRATAR